MFRTGQLRVSSFTPGQLTYRTSHLLLQTQISESVSDQETPSSPSTWREAGSAILDFLPFVGNIKAGVEALTGKDAITGRHLEGWERALAGAAIIGGPLAKGVSRGIKGIDNRGRSGKQSRLKEIANDDKVSTALRGEIKQDINEIKLGKRKNIRVPQGYNLAHRHGYEARKGYGYECSDLQTIRSHRTQHKHDGYGKRIK
ncbi:polymorphic toxin type 8 domain-containing protein [Alkalihalobacillus oceani]|uniref:Polymorphic toxin type 8 domain-containing protein n=1 Tax=Halalkalibacter oceani TaxID=1653776 RepID=A0A9X2IN01_9BACI|nr:polymorphic toxin type 8 domain-containing protein [Halalkalibacter oceani]MCM3714439.1 polymorphic toxin type 8 domain-containing protein [Halalkalibacter oceani]